MAADPAADAGFLSRWSRRKALVRQGVQPAEPAAVPAAAAPTRAERPLAQPLAPSTDAAPDAAPEAAAQTAPPPPTLADVAALDRDGDYARFVAPGVDRGVKNAALKKLFTDPHFNVMDGLDIYIDDYGRPDPLPAGMLRQLVQSQSLGLFSDEPAIPAVAQPAAQPAAPPAAPSAGAPFPAAADPAVAAGSPALGPDASAASTADALNEPALPPPSTVPPAQARPDEDAALRLQPHDAAGPAGAGPGAGPHAGRQC